MANSTSWSPVKDGLARERQRLVLSYLEDKWDVASALREAGVTRASYNKWRSSDPEFKSETERLRNRHLHGHRTRRRYTREPSYAEMRKRVVAAMRAALTELHKGQREGTMEQAGGRALDAIADAMADYQREGGDAFHFAFSVTADCLWAIANLAESLDGSDPVELLEWLISLEDDDDGR